MQKLVKNYLDEFNKRHKRNRRAIVALLLMAVLVVGGVLGTLSQYGVALEEPEKKPLCGLEEHTHTEECYQDVLICGYGEEAEAAAEPKQEQAAQEPAVREQVEKVLNCGQEEQEGHQHSESCYETKSELICGQEESEGHTHTEACCGEDGELTCELAENEGHTHSDGCYTEEEVLVCGQEEGQGAHTHTEACYTETVSMVPAEITPAGQESSEDSEEAAETHTHTEACYERRLVCGLEEHTHTEACYIDGAADVETASDWEEMFADVEWKEQWGEDLVTAAQMQIGYQESQANYQSEEDGTHKGYTRYGAFMDDPYMDWNAAFVNFCLYYAGLNEEDVFPEETNAGEWYKTFVEADENNADYITLPEEYEPKAGDIVFLEDEEKEDTLMGIVSSYDEETGEAKVIAGDDGDEVTEETYVVKGEAADESPINSYLMTTELEDHIKNNTRIMRAEGEDYTVTVRFTDAAEIPEDAILNVREIEEGTDEYQTYYEQSLEAMEAEELSFARYFDITFLANGEEIEPLETVNVTISYADPIEAGETDMPGVVHFTRDGQVEVLDVETNVKNDGAVASETDAETDSEEGAEGYFFRFDQNSFSVTANLVAGRAAETTVVLRPYNDNGTDQNTNHYPYRFKVDGKTTVFTSISSVSITTDKILLPSDTARKDGFKISTNDSSHYITDYDGVYKWKLKGWYNVTTEKYYSVVKGSYEVPVKELESGKKNVFYADWEAASYDIGQETDNELGKAIDTQGYSFINTELFDYNELVNITLNEETGYGRKRNSTNDENWVAPKKSNAAMVFVNGAFGYNTARYNLGSSGESGTGVRIPTDSVEGILKILFDSSGTYKGITPLGEADGLFYQNADGSYEYDSNVHAASFNKRLQRFYVYEKNKTRKISDTNGSNTAFLPLNGGTEKYEKTNATVNYWFGMKTEIDYWLDNESGKGGNKINGNDMQFEFTGDDDVWVFDQVADENGKLGEKTLVLDLSSCHSKWTGTINFSTGVVVEKDDKGHVLKNEVANSGKGFGKGEHKLTIYYLERGGGDSNCKIKFNLAPSWNYEGDPMQKITVEKQWADENGKPYDSTSLPLEIVGESEETGKTVSVNLYEADENGNKIGEALEKEPVKLSKANNWTWNWYKPKGKNYLVEEVEDKSDDSYIMSSNVKNGPVDYSCWIDSSNLIDQEKIVIGNGKDGEDGRVLAVQDGNIVSVKHEAVLNEEGDPDVLKNDDADAEGKVSNGIPLERLWIVHRSDDGERKKFEFESAVSPGYYLSIRDGSLNLTKESDKISLFYFNEGDEGNLTGTQSGNKLVVVNNTIAVKGGNDASKTARVHLYRYITTGEKKGSMTSFVITNKLLKAKIQIQKVDRTETDRLLGNAKFNLYRVGLDGKETLMTEGITTSPEGTSPGIVNIGSLDIGTYHLKETQAPIGYALLKDPIVITVSKEGTGTEAKAKVEVNFNNAWANGKEGFETVGGQSGHLTYADGTFTIEVPNVLLYELPSTGGIGTYWYTIGGTLLLIAAALVLYKRKYAGRY